MWFASSDTEATSSPVRMSACFGAHALFSLSQQTHPLSLLYSKQDYVQICTKTERTALRWPNSLHACTPERPAPSIQIYLSMDNLSCA